METAPAAEAATRGRATRETGEILDDRAAAIRVARTAAKRAKIPVKEGTVELPEQVEHSRAKAAKVAKAAKAAKRVPRKHQQLASIVPSGAISRPHSSRNYVSSPASR